MEVRLVFNGWNGPPDPPELPDELDTDEEEMTVVVGAEAAVPCSLAISAWRVFMTRLISSAELEWTR
jgi:hypothetical protein